MKLPRMLPSLLATFVFAGLICCFVTPARAQMASQLYADAVQAYNGGDIAVAKRKLQLTLEVDKNFRPASILLIRINKAEQDAQGIAQGTAAVPVPIKSLEKITFPVEFKDTSLQTTLEFIRQHVETASGGKTQLNFVLQLPPELASKKISLQLSHMPVTEMLHYIGDLAGVSFQTQKYAIMVVPATTAPANGIDPVGTSAHP